MPINLTYWDGNAINNSTYYKVLIDANADVSLQTNFGIVEREQLHPTINSQKYTARRIPVIVFPDILAAGISREQWSANVNQLFTPYKKEKRIIKGTYLGITLRALAVVESIKISNNYYGAFEVNLLLEDPIWEGDTEVTGVSSPIVPIGNVPVNPRYFITPVAGNMKRVPVNVQERTGRGLIDYWLRIGPFDSSGAGVSLAKHYMVIHHGTPIPFYVRQWGHSTLTTVDALITMAADEETDLDVYFGSDIDNEVTSQKLDLAGMNPDHASFSNTQWHWNSWANVMSNPNRPGTFRIAGTFNRDAYVYFKDVDTVELMRYTGSHPGLSGMDALYLSIPAGAAGGNLHNVSMQVTNPLGWPEPPGFISSLFYAWRFPGDTAWTISNLASYHATITIPAGATEIALVAGSGAFGGRMEMASLNTYIALDPNTVPLVTVGTPVATARIEGNITNTLTGDNIVFRETIVDANVPLEIDTTTGAINPTGRMQTAGIIPSGEGRILPLVNGVSNTLTYPSNVSVLANYRPRIQI